MKKTRQNYNAILAIIMLLAIFSIMLVGCASPFASAAQGITEDKRTFNKISDKRMFAEAEDYKGYVYKKDDKAFCFRLKFPERMEEGKVYPLVVFLHGMGDWGTNNSSHMYRSLIDSVAKYAPDDCYVFMPQSIKDYDWTSDEGTMADKGGMDTLYNACLDQIISENSIDTSRVYLTGMSMGGQGTMWQASEHTDKYAGLIAVCGVLNYGYNFIPNYARLANTPTWFFHSTNDSVVPYQNSVQMHNALVDLGNADVHITLNDKKLHDITAITYDSAELWTWLFSKRLQNNTLN